MKPILLLAATLALSSAALAQTPIEAPSGWTSQTRANGATTFVPPDLKEGEKYSVTIFPLASPKEQKPDEFLRAFAGKVGTAPGQLTAPLQITVSGKSAVTGQGVYNGANGAQLGVRFVGLLFQDGAAIRVARFLLSDKALFNRYGKGNAALVSEMIRTTKQEKSP